MATLIKKTVEGQPILKDVSNPTPDSIIAPTENNPTSLHTYATGAYAKVKGVLRKVLSPISAGQAFTNTNSEATTVGEELTRINTDLSDIGKPVLLGSASNIHTEGINLNDDMTKYKTLLFVSQANGNIYSCSVPVSLFKSTTSSSQILYTSGVAGAGGFYYLSDSSVGTGRFSTYNFNAWVYGIK